MKNAAPEVIAETAVTYVAAATGVSVLYTVYKVVDIMYPIIKAGAEEYAKTGDKDKAVEAMGKETVNQVKEAIRDFTVEKAVGACVSVAVQASGGQSDTVRDETVTAAVSTTISEMIP